MRGYQRFALFKNIKTHQWLSKDAIDASVPEQVIFYTKKITDEYEDKYNL